MPYIQVSTTKKLSKDQCQTLKSGFGALISLIPGKTEQQLLLDISDSHCMYMAGEEKENCAFVDVRIYGAAGFAQKAEFTEKVFLLLEQQLGLKEEEIYVCFGEYGVWGTKGKLK